MFIFFPHPTLSRFAGEGSCCAHGLSNSTGTAFQAIQRNHSESESTPENSDSCRKAPWKKLRGRKFHDLKFRRQVPLGSFIVDFYCAEHRLIIEVDGCIHAFKANYDHRRQKFIEEGNYNVLRFTNVQVKESMDFVLSQILSATETRLPSPIYGRG